MAFWAPGKNVMAPRAASDPGQRPIIDGGSMDMAKLSANRDGKTAAHNNARRRSGIMESVAR